MENVKLPKGAITRLSQTSENDMDYLLALYRHCVKDFAMVNKIHGYPKVSRNTATFIIDEAKDMSYFALLWMNNGFSSSDNMEDFVIDMSGVTIEYKSEEQL